MGLMRATSMSNVWLDRLATREEIGELAKLGAALGRDVHVLESEEDPGHTAVVFESRSVWWLRTELAALVAIASTAGDTSVDDVLSSIRQRLADWGFPLDTRPSDARPIGAGAEGDTGPQAE